MISHVSTLSCRFFLLPINRRLEFAIINISTFNACVVRYGDVFRTHILGKAIIVSTDPDVSKTILQNHGNAFIPCYPKSITELLGKSSILQINGSLHKRLHTLIGVFLKSSQFKDRITRDIEKTVLLSLSSWMDKNCHVYLQDETKKVCLFIVFLV